jgi:hypothetical protein
MRVQLILAFSAAAILSGCAPGAILYHGSRTNSKPLIQTVMAEAHPKLDSAAAAECVIKAMSVGEVLKLGTSDTTVITAGDKSTVLAFADRPLASECLTALPEAPAP